MKQRQLIGQRKVQEAVPYVNWPSVLTFQMTSQLKTICKHTICRILLPSFLPTLFLYFVIFYLFIYILRMVTVHVTFSLIST